MKNPRDDEQELINAEFESMIENLDLDQSSHRSYLDELDDIDAHLSQTEKLSYSSPQPLGGVRSSFAALCATIKNWFHRKDSDNGDGAIL